MVSRTKAMGRGEVLAMATLFGTDFISISTQFVFVKTGYDFVFEGDRGVVEHRRDDRRWSAAHVHVHEMKFCASGVFRIYEEDGFEFMEGNSKQTVDFLGGKLAFARSRRGEELW